MEKQEKYDFFTAAGHLNDEALALSAECMLRPGCRDIHREVQEHLLSCEICHDRVISLYGDLKEESVFSGIARNDDEQVHQRKNKWAGNRFSRIMAAAAVLLILVGVGAVLYYNRDYNPDELFQQNFEPYADILTTKGADNQLMQQAMLYYSLHDYDSAAVLLHRITAMDPSNIPATFYLANVWLSLDRAEDALPHLVQVAGSEHAFSRPARWYLALAYIKLEMPDRAIPHLKELSSAESYYGKKSREILRKLR